MIEKTMYDLPRADTYGGLLISAGKKILLRKPKGNFGGYAWTFAKGRPLPGESAEQTALREVLHETGYRAEIIKPIDRVFTGTTSTTAFYLMGPLGRQGRCCSETAATCWVDLEEAEKLIRETVAEPGRRRDLEILEVLAGEIERLPFHERPATCAEDWKLQPLPKKRRKIALDIFINERDMRELRKGHFPLEMEDHWFSWFDEPVLHLHRSWTGFCLHQVRFEPAEGGWRAVSAWVNRNPKQYTVTDDEEDRRNIRALLEDFVGYARMVATEGPPPSFLSEGMNLAMQPNYLGSPKVVSGLLQTVIEAAIAFVKHETSLIRVWQTVWILGQQVATGDEFVRMPGWHTPQGLGEWLCQYFALHREPIFAEDLAYPVSEALMALVLKVRDMVMAFEEDPAAEWNPHALTQINALHEWAVTVFLGTNDLLNPGKTIDDFGWRRVS
ncbi:NUDIX domain-containing protein [Cereibacter sphaeroides]|uniref:NUDIX domain-containing protein n=1 Tax=Cereibacter sphaeroides TaxID=1063 RepID=UPI001F257654|nr:NUDIX domain-containing protein [Cereibacter sphaeroides]MCE6967286.1 NUDIX domain-containing protein [Cereibacter sphaeroides]